MVTKPQLDRQTHRGVPDAPACWSSTTLTDDIDQHAQAQPQWKQDYQQLSPGRFKGMVQHVQLPGVRLVCEESNLALRQRGNLGAGAYGFAMAVRQSGQAIFNGQRVTCDAIMCGRGDTLDLCSPPDFQLFAAVVEAPLLEELWETLYLKPPSRWLEAQLVLPVRPAAAAALRALHLQVMALISQPASAVPDAAALRLLRDSILIEWIEALPAHVDTSRLLRVGVRKQLVDRACELMLSCAGETISMLAICQRLGTSRRNLNYCFLEVLGMNPVKYFRAIRLNGVRRELNRGQSTVQDAAGLWGFWHLGQFSGDYKQQFGELPSTTLKRAS